MFFSEYINKYKHPSPSILLQLPIILFMSSGLLIKLVNKVVTAFHISENTFTNFYHSANIKLH